MRRGDPGLCPVAGTKPVVLAVRISNGKNSVVRLKKPSRLRIVSQPNKGFRDTEMELHQDDLYLLLLLVVEMSGVVCACVCVCVVMDATTTTTNATNP